MTLSCAHPATTGSCDTNMRVRRPAPASGDVQSLKHARPKKGWSRSEQGHLAAAEHLMVGHLDEVVEEDEVGDLLVRGVPG